MVRLGTVLSFALPLALVIGCGSRTLDVESRSNYEASLNQQGNSAQATNEENTQYSPQSFRDMGTSAQGLGQQVGNSTQSIGSALQGLFSITRQLAFAVGTMAQHLMWQRSRTGTTIIHWGHADLPEGAKALGSSLLYGGQAYAGYHTHPRGHEVECIAPGQPGQAWKNQHASAIYPTIIGGGGYHPDAFPENKLLACSVMFVPSTTVVMKGTDSCPANWSLVYGGYLFSGHYAHPGGSPSSICVDATNFDYSKPAGSGNYSHIYGVHLSDTTHEVSGFKVNHFLKCAVCAKD